MRNFKKTCKNCIFSPTRPFNGSVYGSCYGCNNLSLWRRKVSTLLPVLLIGLSMITFIFCIIFFLMTAGDVSARELYTAPKMPNFTSECQQLTKIRTRVSYRIDHRATQRCVVASQRQWNQQQLQNSYLEYNAAATDLMVDRTRLKNRR